MIPCLSPQHGFSSDNFKELLFAMKQLLSEREKPTVRYARIVDQILLELRERVQRGSVKVDSEVI